MLEKLGEVLRKATDKIANAIFLDKNLVDSIIKDLQRALIEADVNIALVKELSDKIRKTAFDERMKGVEKKEQLIKLLHDELIKILGKHKTISLEKGQNRIMLLGLYGAGKCVHEKSKIQISDGNIIEIKKLYENYVDILAEEFIEGGKIVNIENENLLVPSYNPKTQEIENKKATHLWKLKKEELVEIKLDNGNDYLIKVTPEHPFFVLRNGQVLQIRADEITEQDFISIPNKIDINGKQVNLFNEIKKFDLDCYLPYEEIKEYLQNSKTFLKTCKNLKHKRNYEYLSISLKKGKIPLELINPEIYNSLKIKGQKEKKIITLPLFITSEFAEFLGYVLGDGYLSERYIGIANEDKEIINRVIELSKTIFNITPTLTKDKRTKNLYQIRLNSKTLVKIFEIFNLKPGRKGKKLEIPRQIMQSDKETIRKFIRAYFDCDSYPSKKRRYIELTSESQILIQQMDLLLRRFGILSTISKKIINNILYWRLSIKSKYAEIYADKIGYEIERKKNVVDNYKTIGILQGSGNQDMIPLGKILKALRLQLGFSIGEIQENVVYSYGIYEKKGFISREKLIELLQYYRLKKQGFIWGFLKNIDKDCSIKEKYPYRIINGTCKYLKDEELININNKQILLSKKGQNFLQNIEMNSIQTELLLQNLERISQSNICWIPVQEITKVKNDSEFVYDLTVEGNHSFISEGFIVHNTTTIAKLGNYFAKRGNKAALVGLDVHRPAAPEQLKQLAERNKLNCFVDLKEKNPLKIWKENKKELKDYKVVLIDTAGRHTLDESLIKEIKTLNKEINPTEIILVMPADIGQAAKKQAKEFLEAVNISGVIITRMDSSAKGGGALTACAETKAPVYFIGTGEKINDIEPFNSESFLSRLLGMGDLHTLMEKIHSVTGEGKQKAMEKKIKDGKISLEDVIDQVKSMNQLGGFEKIKGMIPGFSSAKIPENILETQEAKISKWEHIIKSMTPEEKENPELLEKQTKRIGRISQGAGVNNSDVRALLKQYKLLNDMLGSGEDFDPSKGLSQKQMQKLAKKFGKMKRIKF